MAVNGDFSLAADRYFYLAKTGYLDLATSGYFFMATDSLPAQAHMKHHPPPLTRSGAYRGIARKRLRGHPKFRPPERESCHLGRPTLSDIAVTAGHSTTLQPFSFSMYFLWRVSSCKSPGQMLRQ